MGTRLELHALLEIILGSKNVYFQPPPDFKMKYPCIIYERNKIYSRYADNIPYNLQKQYNITVIDANPDSTIPDAVSKLQSAAFDRRFVSNNLNHNVFNILF
jgi:hypothetical protein